MYAGTAWMLASPDTAYTNDQIDVSDHNLEFVFILGGIHDKNLVPENSLIISPNPSSGIVTMSFKIEKPEIVSIQIYSQSGQLIRTLADQKFDAGQHQLQWDGKDASGIVCAAGMYTVRLQTGSGSESKLLIRVP
jgi:flagellar hook assembly protein FlgD